MKHVSTTTIQLLILVLYSAVFWGLQQNLENSLWFTFGLILGWGLLFFDQMWLKYHYLEQGHLDQSLITRSAFFLIVYAPLSLFIVTSSGSLVGVGSILGMGISLACEMLAAYRQPEDFHRTFLSQVKKMLSVQEIRNIVWSFVGLVAFLSFLVFR